MAVAVKVRQGGAVGAATTDFTSAVQMIDGPYDFSVGMQFDTRGGASLSQFTIDDDANTAYVPRAHNLVTVTENASGVEYTIHLGRVAAGEGARGQVDYDVARILPVKSEDANVDLDGITLIGPWVRPVETGTVRVLAMGVAFLTGGVYRNSTNITVARWLADGTGHLVKPHPVDGEASMPAKTYPPGTRLVEILADCAETEGQAYGVVLHNSASGAHPCLQYCEEDDWDVHPSTLSITDSSPNYTTSFPPMWDNGPAINREGQEVSTGLVVKWGTGDDSYVVTEDTALTDTFDRWILPYNDSRAQTATAAANRAPHLLKGQNTEHVTHSLSIKIPASKVHLIRAGMSISLRAAASRNTETLGTSATRRVASVMMELDQPTIGGVEGQYLVHLQLARPQKIARTRQGPLTPKAASPGGSPIVLYSSLSGEQTDYGAVVGTNITGGAGRILIGLILKSNSDTNPLTGTEITYRPAGAVSDVNNRVLTMLVESTAFGIFYATDVPVGNASASVFFNITTSHTYMMGVVYADAPSIRATATGTGTGTSSSVAVTSQVNDLVIGLSAQFATNIDASLLVPTVGSGQTVLQTALEDAAFGQADSHAGLGRDAADSGTTTDVWNFNGSRGWKALALSLTGTVGDTPEPTGDSGAVGVDETLARSDHTHAHGTHSTGDLHPEYQKESEKAVANGYASLGSTALVPMAQLATGTPDGTKFVRDDGTLVVPSGGGGMSNPMTTAGDIIKGGAAGVAERLAIGTAGHVLKVVSGAPAWAAETGGGVSDPYAAEYKYTSGTAVDFSAATASGLTVANVTGYLKLLTSTASLDYWDAAVTYGTADFDVAARIIFLGQTTEISGVHTSPVLDFYVSDAARTARPSVRILGPSESTATNNQIQGLTAGLAAATDVHAGLLFPLILRIKRVGTALTYYFMGPNQEVGTIWTLTRGITDSTDIVKVGFRFQTTNTESKVLIGWVRNI